MNENSNENLESRLESAQENIDHLMNNIDNKLKELEENEKNSGIIDDNDESFLNKQVPEILSKIIEMPDNTETTIAELINYNPDKVFVSPLMQGKIFNAMKEQCEKNNIDIVEIRDGFGGLAYHYKFKKINYDNELKKMSENIDNMISEIDKKIEEIDNLSEEKLREIINELTQGEYIKLSEWYGGRRESGFNGLIINLDNLYIFQYNSVAHFENGIVSKNSINCIGSLSTNGIKKIEEYFDNNSIFAFNKAEKLVMDAGTSIEIKYKNIETEIVNGDRKYSNNKLSYYDDLLEIVNNNKIDIVNKEKSDINLQIYDDLINDLDNRLKELEEEENNTISTDENEMTKENDEKNKVFNEIRSRLFSYQNNFNDKFSSLDDSLSEINEIYVEIVNDFSELDCYIMFLDNKSNQVSSVISLIDSLDLRDLDRNLINKYGSELIDCVFETIKNMIIPNLKYVHKKIGLHDHNSKNEYYFTN